ncbi:putative nucleotidyltransferase [Spinactinospora alkalitolerans]|uniref:Putative nucleotidyltransferase n=1 Tax=Spinactinospora alkalitolerans TaxID=687207 RepID=A0A852TUW7_9ACTN|nr:nucleotidyltransferase family protein [Spinactinospora alkalitolerans]NYE48246.1 putative nucleotidyltransferase [Spinactinospora alkalitolerans]
MSDGAEVEALLTTLKRVAATLKAEELPFALSGSFAAYARGAEASTHDVDFVVLPEDVERVVEVLTKAGMRRADTVEDWLAKVYDDDRLVDLIHRPGDRPVTREVLDRASSLKVHSVHVPVLDATDLLIMLLESFTEHECDFARPLATARSLREQADWERVYRESSHSPYAHAFLVLLERLEVIEARKETAVSKERPQYLATHLKEALAEDPRTGELGVQVHVRGDDVYLTGEVPCAQRRRKVIEVAREMVPDYQVHDELTVAHIGGRPEEERLP